MGKRTLRHRKAPPPAGVSTDGAAAGSRAAVVHTETESSPGSRTSPSTGPSPRTAQGGASMPRLPSTPSLFGKKGACARLGKLGRARSWCGGVSPTPWWRSAAAAACFVAAVAVLARVHTVGRLDRARALAAQAVHHGRHARCEKLSELSEESLDVLRTSAPVVAAGMVSASAGGWALGRMRHAVTQDISDLGVVLAAEQVMCLVTSRRADEAQDAAIRAGGLPTMMAAGARVDDLTFTLGVDGAAGDPSQTALALAPDMHLVLNAALDLPGPRLPMETFVGEHADARRIERSVSQNGGITRVELSRVPASLASLLVWSADAAASLSQFSTAEAIYAHLLGQLIVADVDRSSFAAGGACEAWNHIVHRLRYVQWRRLLAEGENAEVYRQTTEWLEQYTTRDAGGNYVINPSMRLQVASVDVSVTVMAQALAVYRTDHNGNHSRSIALTGSATAATSASAAAGSTAIAEALANLRAVTHVEAGSEPRLFPQPVERTVRLTNASVPVRLEEAWAPAYALYVIEGVSRRIKQGVSKLRTSSLTTDDNMFHEGLAMLRWALAADPTPAEWTAPALAMLCEAELDGGELDRGIPACVEALRQDPALVEAVRSLGKAFDALMDERAATERHGPAAAAMHRRWKQAAERARAHNARRVQSLLAPGRADGHDSSDGGSSGTADSGSDPVAGTRGAQGDNGDSDSADGGAAAPSAAGSRDFDEDDFLEPVDDADVRPCSGTPWCWVGQRSQNDTFGPMPLSGLRALHWYYRQAQRNFAWIVDAAPYAAASERTLGQHLLQESMANYAEALCDVWGTYQWADSEDETSDAADDEGDDVRYLLRAVRDARRGSQTQVGAVGSPYVVADEAEVENAEDDEDYRNRSKVAVARSQQRSSNETGTKLRPYGAEHTFLSERVDPEAFRHSKDAPAADWDADVARWALLLQGASRADGVLRLAHDVFDGVGALAGRLAVEADAAGAATGIDTPLDGHTVRRTVARELRTACSAQLGDAWVQGASLSARQAQQLVDALTSEAEDFEEAGDWRCAAVGFAAAQGAVVRARAAGLDVDTADHVAAALSRASAAASGAQPQVSQLQAHSPTTGAAAAAVCSQTFALPAVTALISAERGDGGADALGVAAVDEAALAAEAAAARAAEVAQDFAAVVTITERALHFTHVAKVLPAAQQSVQYMRMTHTSSRPDSITAKRRADELRQRGSWAPHEGHAPTERGREQVLAGLLAALPNNSLYFKRQAMVAADEGARAAALLRGRSALKSAPLPSRAFRRASLDGIGGGVGGAASSSLVTEAAHGDPVVMLLLRRANALYRTGRLGVARALFAELDKVGGFEAMPLADRSAALFLKEYDAAVAMAPYALGRAVAMASGVTVTTEAGNTPPSAAGTDGAAAGAGSDDGSSGDGAAALSMPATDEEKREAASAMIRRVNAAFEHSSAGRPDHVVTLHVLSARASMVLGDFTAAVTHASRGWNLQGAHNSWRAIETRGDARVGTGDNEGAKGDYEKALSGLGSYAPMAVEAAWTLFFKLTRTKYAIMAGGAATNGESLTVTGLQALAGSGLIARTSVCPADSYWQRVRTEPDKVVGFMNTACTEPRQVMLSVTTKGRTLHPLLGQYAHAAKREVETARTAAREAALAKGEEPPSDAAQEVPTYEPVIAECASEHAFVLRTALEEMLRRCYQAVDKATEDAAVAAETAAQAQAEAEELAAAAAARTAVEAAVEATLGA